MPSKDPTDRLPPAKPPGPDQGFRLAPTFLETVIQALPYPFHVIDVKNHRIVFSNQVTDLSNGAPLRCHEISHQSPHPCTGAEHPCPLEQVKASKRPYVTEHIHYDAAGQRRIVEVHGYPVFDQAGEVAYMIESAVDITDRRRAEDALRESQEQLVDLLDNANDLVQSVGPDGRFLYVNRAWLQTLGYSEEDLERLTVFDVIHPANRAHCEALFHDVMAGGDPGNMVVDFVTQDGRKITVEGNVNTRFEAGHPVATRGIFRDITARRKAEEMLREERKFSADLLRFSAVPTFVISADHKVLMWNRACEELTGIRAEEVIGTPDHWKPFYPEKRPVLADLILSDHLDELPRYYRHFHPSRLSPEGMSAAGWLDNIGGRRRYLSFEAVPIRNSRNEIVAVVETLQDVTVRKEREEELTSQATMDALTGIANRRKLEQVLLAETARARRYQTPLSVILFDIDHFKRVNDTLGHDVGDFVLQRISGLLKDNIRETDYVGRWGGEEFVVVATETPGEKAAILAEKLRGLIASHPFERPKTVTVSAGVCALHPEDTVEEALKNADQALYQAKHTGRNRIVVFTGRE